MLAQPAQKPVRKDAQYNRAHILDVAARAFAGEGVDVSMDAIAKQAGIGSGTLYRHFPNKDALLAALLAPHYVALEERRIAIEQEQADTGHRLNRWIDALGKWMLAYDGLPEPLRLAWAATNSPLKRTCDDLVATTNGFLRAAQADGYARPSVSGQDVFLGALAMAWAGGKAMAYGSTPTALHDVFRTGWATDALTGR